MNIENKTESIINVTPELCKTEVQISEYGAKIIQIVNGVPYAGQSETYNRVVEPVNEFRANLPA